MPLRYPDSEDVVLVNSKVVSQFKGTHAVLNLGNLEYCIAGLRDTPEILGDTQKTLALKATRLMFCLVRNHPFLDGNKRTAYQSAQAFLILNGFDFYGITPQEAVLVLANVAEGKATEQRILDWVEKHLRQNPVQNKKKSGQSFG